MKIFRMTACLFLLILAACSGQESNSNNSDLNGSQSNSEGESTYVTRGVTDDEILIGNLGPQTGPAAIQGNYMYGLMAYFNYINENGGIHGRNLKLVAYDDQYQPSQTVQQATRLVEEDEVFLMIGNQGTANNRAAKDYYEKNKVVSLLVNTGASDFTSDNNPYWLGTGISSYEIEGEILLDYAVNKLGAERIAIIYQNDDYGKIGLDTLQKSIDKYEGAEIVAEVPYVTGSADYTTQVLKVKESKPDVIFSFSLLSPAANMKKALYNQGVDAPYIVTANGGNDPNQFELAGADVWEGTISSSPYLHDDPQLEVYFEQMKKDYPNVPEDGVAKFGWAAAQVLVEGIERAGADLTMDKFIDSLYTMDKWDGSIYASVTFAPDNHFGLTSLYVTEAKDGKISAVGGAIHYDPGTKEITYENDKN